MSAPCTQEAPIAQLVERSNSHQRALDRFADAVKKNNQLLEQVAMAITSIKHLHEDQSRTERSVEKLGVDLNSVYGRLRDLELYPGKQAGKAWWIIFSMLAGAAGSLVTGIILVLLREVKP